MRLRVLDPTAEDTSTQAIGTARLKTLAGCTVGLLDNGKIRVLELLNHMEAILRARHGVAEVLRFKKPDASRPAPADVVAAMQQCDAIITAVGD